jgi:splicing factor 3A subunit 3
MFSWQALAALGLKSGGTIQQRAERLFLTKVGIVLLPCMGLVSLGMKKIQWASPLFLVSYLIINLLVREGL